MTEITVIPATPVVIQVDGSIPDGQTIQVVGNLGAGGGDKSYTKVFTSQSEVTVTHGLNKYPSVTIIDSAGTEVEGTVTHNDANELVVAFTSSFTGTIICN